MPEWRCPKHGGTKLRDAGEALECPRGDPLPGRNGIPRFVADEDYTSSFGLQWNRYRLTQLDSYTATAFSRDRARRCVGAEGWKRLDGAKVLECGCGAGRFTEVLLEWGARVTSVDLTWAVNASPRSFSRDRDHRVAQADILALPFEPQRFDVVLCLGVIQHTPNPETTIARLHEQVTPGGALVIYHYAYRPGWYLSLKPLYRRAFRRVSVERGMRVTERVMDPMRPLHRRAGRLGKLLNRVSPVYSFYRRVPWLPDEHQRAWALLDSQDGLTNWDKWFRTPGQIRRTLERIGLENTWVTKGGNGIEARGRRPTLGHP